MGIHFGHVFIAYFSTRIWSFAITTLHWKIDWKKLRIDNKLNLHLVRDMKTPYVDGGVINMIYAIEPPAPQSFFSFAYVVEGFCALVFAIITLLPIKPETRIMVFEHLGAKPIVGVTILSYVSIFFVLLGGLTIFGGALVAYNVKHCCKKDRKDENESEGGDKENKSARKKTNIATNSYLLTSKSQNENVLECGAISAQKIKDKKN